MSTFTRTEGVVLNVNKAKPTALSRIPGSPSEIDGAGGIEVVLDRLRLDGVTKEQPVSSLSGGEKAPWRSGT